MELTLNELKPNPFKRFIDDGKLNEDRISVLIESIEHGTLPEHFFIRRNENGENELCSGHHRVEALKRKKGKDYVVDTTIVKYTDEQMLIDMVRENITQRDTDFHDKQQSIVLAREWLRSGVNSVKQFHNIMKGKKGFQAIKKEDSCRSIAGFLSKNGKAVDYHTVADYIRIYDVLDKTLQKEVGSDEFTVRDAISLSRIEDKEEQKIIANVVKEEEEESGHARSKLVTKYLELPEEVKDRVKEGALSLKEISIPDNTMGSGEMAIKFEVRATGLINEMRTLRKALFQFRSEKLFDNFTPKQRGVFKTRFETIKQVYNELIKELENSIKVL